jgi:hypothetical protein
MRLGLQVSYRVPGTQLHSKSVLYVHPPSLSSILLTCWFPPVPSRDSPLCHCFQPGATLSSCRISFTQSMRTVLLSSSVLTARMQMWACLHVCLEVTAGPTKMACMAPLGHVSGGTRRHTTSQPPPRTERVWGPKSTSVSVPVNVHLVRDVQRSWKNQANDPRFDSPIAQESTSRHK